MKKEKWWQWPDGSLAPEILVLGILCVVFVLPIICCLIAWIAWLVYKVQVSY